MQCLLSHFAIVGSHQATLKELSRVRHELLKAQVSAAAPPVQTQSDEEKAFIMPSMVCLRASMYVGTLGSGVSS